MDAWSGPFRSGRHNVPHANAAKPEMRQRLNIRDSCLDGPNTCTDPAFRDLTFATVRPKHVSNSSEMVLSGRM